MQKLIGQQTHKRFWQVHQTTEYRLNAQIEPGSSSRVSNTAVEG